MSGHAYTAEGVRAPGAPRARGELPRAAAALGFAALCALAMVVVYLVFAHVPAAKTRDATTLHDFMRLNTSFISINGPRLLKLLSPALFTLWGIAIVCFALARGRPRAAFAAALLMAVAPLTAEVLKPLLAHPHVQIGHFHVGAASWPSGHATAALALVLSVLLVVPDSWRRVVAWLGAAFALAVGLVLLILAWHMPSDVIGGYLLALLFGALAVAGLRATERRRAQDGADPGS